MSKTKVGQDRKQANLAGFDFIELRSAAGVFLFGGSDDEAFGFKMADAPGELARVYVAALNFDKQFCEFLGGEKHVGASG